MTDEEIETKAEITELRADVEYLRQRNIEQVKKTLKAIDQKIKWRNLAIKYGAPTDGKED